MDIGYRAGQQLILALLDWEKAFDNLDQEAMHEALGRMNLPTKYKNLIRELYKHPTFKWKQTDSTQNGKNKEQVLDKDAHYRHTCSSLS